MCARDKRVRRGRCSEMRGRSTPFECDSVFGFIFSVHMALLKSLLEVGLLFLLMRHTFCKVCLPKPIRSPSSSVKIRTL